MIAVYIQEKLRASSVLIEELGRTKVAGTELPNVFERHAPEKAEHPFIVFKINPWSDVDDVHGVLTLTVEIYDYSPSTLKSKNIRDAVRMALDRQSIETEPLGRIWIYHRGGDLVEQEDPRAIQWHMLFEVRHTSDKFVKELS